MMTALISGSLFVVTVGSSSLAASDPSFELLGLAFAAGFLFSFNPVTFASIPVALAYVAKGEDRPERLWHSGAFILGLLVTHASLGAIAGFGGDWMHNIMGHEWGILIGPLLLILGLSWMGWLKLPVGWATSSLACR